LKVERKGKETLRSVVIARVEMALLESVTRFSISRLHVATVEACLIATLLSVLMAAKRIVARGELRNS